MNAPDYSLLPPRKSAEESRYFGFIASLPCAVSLRHGVQVAHVRFADAWFNKPPTGVGIKPRVPYCLPLTPEMHAEQSNMGEREFWTEYGFNCDCPRLSPLTLCWTLWGLFLADETHAGEAVIRNWRN